MTRAGLRDLAVAVLKASGTLVGDNVHSPLTKPTSPGAMPILQVQTPLERKISMGRAAPLFTTSVTLAIVGRLTHPNETTLQVALDTLVDQVHAAILGSYDLLRVVQQFSEVETSAALTGEGSQPIGECVMHFHCELNQKYQPPVGAPLTSIDVKLQRNGQVSAEALITLPQT